MGEVYEATHDRLSGRYAVKVLGAEVAGHPESFLRFKREAQVTSSLEHPGIVKVIDFNQTPDGLPYLVMEYLDGRDLAQVISTEGPLPLERVVDLVDQIASALGAAHRQGVVHRDLKPQNIFVLAVDGRDVVKLVDFGISKVKSVSQHLTRESSILGTPQYMAPEQAVGKTDVVDSRSDQFALAAIAYELLTGRRPFSGDSLVSLVYQIVHTDPPLMNAVAVRAPVPAAVEAVIRRAMAKSREQRFASVLELAAALKVAAAGTVPSPGPVSAAGLRRAPPTPPPGGTRLASGPGDLVLGTTLGSTTGQVRTQSRRRGGRLGTVLLVTTAAALAAMVTATVLRSPPPPVTPAVSPSASPAVIPAPAAAVTPAKAAAAPPSPPPPAPIPQPPASDSPPPRSPLRHDPQPSLRSPRNQPRGRSVRREPKPDRRHRRRGGRPERVSPWSTTCDGAVGDFLSYEQVFTVSQATAVLCVGSKVHVSAPGPPSRRLCPGQSNRVSSPPPPISVSSPGSPSRLPRKSLPAPPSSMSLPSFPMTTSYPSLPFTRSSPAPPMTTSSPAPPESMA
jgi:eukaryotic-like serine/threonine-protein kinase